MWDSVIQKDTFSTVVFAKDTGVCVCVCACAHMCTHTCMQMDISGLNPLSKSSRKYNSRSCEIKGISLRS